MYEFSREIRQILEASKVPFALLQVEGTGYEVLLVSEGVCTLFGLSRPELKQYLNNMSYSMMHPDDAGKLLNASRSMATEDDLSLVVRMKLHGADDYRPILFKTCAYYAADGTRLVQVLYLDIDATSDLSESVLARYERQQQDRFFRDEVTGLPNSNYYHEFALATLKSILDEGKTPLIVIFDIHGMHFYNDSYGYEAGDALLKKTGEIVQSVFPDDFCVRYLEDHFVVILRKGELADRVEEVRRQVRAFSKGDSLDIEAGVYEYTDPSEGSASALDKARRAVDSIRDRPDEHLCWYDAQVEEKYHQQNYVLSQYHEAIERGWIKVYYQPLISTLSGYVSHCEALARWIDPTYGVLSPGTFITVLEENHKVWEVDLEIIRQVARDVHAAKRMGRSFPPLSVNVSRHDLVVPGFHERINDILDECGVGHDEIAIEITESALAEHEELIGRHVQRFHEDGYQVWLDDFGSGYSSFNALQNFDFDLLKIDMQFLRSQNERTPDILSEIVDLTKRLGIRSVTEGVETQEQVEFLRQIGCGMLQGFYFSKPIPGDEFFEQVDKLGLAIETPDDRHFYEGLSRVNVLNVDHPIPDADFLPLEGEKSISLVVEEAGVYHVIYLDRAGVERVQRYGVSSLEQLNEAINSVDGALYPTLHECCAELKGVGEKATRGIHDPRFVGRIEVELIACDQRRRGFVVSCLDAGRAAA